MKNSIEEMWQKGFMDKEALIAPQVNDLYNQKSKHITERLSRMFKWNIIGLVVAAVVVLFFTVSGSVNEILFGVFISSMMARLAYVSRKDLLELEKIDKNVCSYTYLKSFDSWMKKVIIKNIFLSRFIYSGLFVSLVLLAKDTEDVQQLFSSILRSSPDTIMLLGVPLFIIAIVTMITLIIAYFAEAIYRFDVRLVYGATLDKMNEIIMDMEELRK